MAVGPTGDWNGLMVTGFSVADQVVGVGVVEESHPGDWLVLAEEPMGEGM